MATLVAIQLLTFLAFTQQPYEFLCSDLVPEKTLWAGTGRWPHTAHHGYAHPHCAGGGAPVIRVFGALLQR